MPRIPLLHDHHNHFFIYSRLAESPNLQTITRKDQSMALLLDLPGDRINLVLCWNDRYYTFSREELETMPPVIICNLSLHGFRVSPRARKMLGPAHEEMIGRMENPEWCEKHLSRILTFVATRGPFDKDLSRRFLGFLEEKGIWVSDDMLAADDRYLSFLRESEISGRITPWTDLDTFMALPGDLKSCVRGIKIFTDGALGQRTAALRDSYLNGGGGLLNHRPEELDERIRRALMARHAVSIHAIGNRALEQVLSVLPAHRKENPGALIRIEHGQFINLKNAFRARELGIVLCMQPNFSSDSRVYLDRLPAGYGQKNNPFRMLIDQAGFIPGKDLLFGSDGMPHGIQAALEQSLFPVHESQKLSLDEFVAGYGMPDFDNGWIDVIIDQEKQRVQTRVLLDA